LYCVPNSSEWEVGVFVVGAVAACCASSEKTDPSGMDVLICKYMELQVLSDSQSRDGRPDMSGVSQLTICRDASRYLTDHLVHTVPPPYFKALHLTAI
jgi:hypothetical protein